MYSKIDCAFTGITLVIRMLHFSTFLLKHILLHLHLSHHSDHISLNKDNCFNVNHQGRKIIFIPLEHLTFLSIVYIQINTEHETIYVYKTYR